MRALSYVSIFVMFFVFSMHSVFFSMYVLWFYFFSVSWYAFWLCYAILNHIAWVGRSFTSRTCNVLLPFSNNVEKFYKKKKYKYKKKYTNENTKENQKKKKKSWKRKNWEFWLQKLWNFSTIDFRISSIYIIILTSLI